MKLKFADISVYEEWKIRGANLDSEQSGEWEDVYQLDFNKLNINEIESKLKTIEVSPTIKISDLIYQITGQHHYTMIDRNGRVFHDEKVEIHMQGECVEKWNIYCFQAQKQFLDCSSKLSDYDIQDGDVLFLRYWKHVYEDVRFNMLPQRSFKLKLFNEFIIDADYITITFNNKYYNSYDSKKRKSLLLYTEEDVELSKFVRFNFASIDKLTADILDVYFIEKPTINNTFSAREYWKAHLEQNLYIASHYLGFTRNKPYDKAESYDIAYQLGLLPEALPCLVILDDYASDEKIVVTILENHDYKKFFRNIVSLIDKANKTGTYLSTYYTESPAIRNHNFKIFKSKFIEELDKQIKQNPVVSQAERIVNYMFYGNTVFINKPEGHVELKDFQNY